MLGDLMLMHFIDVSQPRDPANLVRHTLGDARGNVAGHQLASNVDVPFHLEQQQKLGVSLPITHLVAAEVAGHVGQPAPLVFDLGDAFQVLKGANERLVCRILGGVMIPQQPAASCVDRGLVGPVQPGPTLVFVDRGAARRTSLWSIEIK